MKKQKPKNTLQIITDEGESELESIARTGLAPELQALSCIINLGGDFDVNALMTELQSQSKAIHSGDMKRPESMLISQAHTLNSLATFLINKSLLQTDYRIYESFMRLALRAQNQARMTLETLSNIKNPPVIYAKQANIAHGPQQVNNGPHAAQNPNEQNKVLSVNHGETLDTSRESQAIGSNPEMAALG